MTTKQSRSTEQQENSENYIMKEDVNRDVFESEEKFAAFLQNSNTSAILDRINCDVNDLLMILPKILQRREAVSILRSDRNAKYFYLMCLNAMHTFGNNIFGKEDSAFRIDRCSDTILLECT